jgi:hypothetical protein
LNRGWQVLCIVPFYVELGMRADSAASSAPASLPLGLKLLQLLRLLRVLKVLRHYSGRRVLMYAIANSWRALLVVSPHGRQRAQMVAGRGWRLSACDVT